MNKKEQISKKIYNLDDLKKILTKKKFSLCHGVFDVLHIGHINYLNEAKKIGGTLVVSVTDDKFVNKGPGRPYFKIKDRIEMISNLSCVDYVLINKDKTAINLIKTLKPSFYVKGPDYKINKNDITKNIYKENREVKKYNGKVHYTNTELFSSTDLLKNFFEDKSENVKKFFSNIKSKTNYDNLNRELDKLKDLTILIVGDSIIDEYIFANPLNKSAKDTILNFKILNTEKYIGGVLSVANNVSNFCKKVILITSLSKETKIVNFIKKKLNKNIDLFYTKESSSKIVRKIRLIDKSSDQKQIGMHKYSDENFNFQEQKKLIDVIKKKIKLVNGIIVSDFGHGVVSKNILTLIKKYKKISIAANSQINSTNIGYHSLSNFKNIDCLTMNYFELQHETRSFNEDIKKLAKNLASKLNLKKIYVTNGAKGSLLYNKKINKYSLAPGIKFNVVDRTGSGDTYFALAALSSFLKIKDEESIFLSTIAAYFNLQSFANKKQTDLNDFKKSIFYILK
jgi:rfaE bifunctional protein nucleotidyltransferase chain/domain